MTSVLIRTLKFGSMLTNPENVHTENCSTYICHTKSIIYDVQVLTATTILNYSRLPQK